MRKTPEELLDICLEMAGRGEDWKSFLAGYPESAPEVENLVALAGDVREASAPAEESAPGASAALLRLGWELARQNARREEAASRRRSRWWASGWAKAAVAGVVMLMVGASSVELSARTVPGDFLYPVKIFTERVRFALTSDTADRVELRITFSKRRLAEVAKTLKEGKGADRKLIESMLAEAQEALADASELPESKASAYKAQIVSLERLQKDRLRSLEGLVPADRRQDVAEALGMCDAGWDRMRGMMQGMMQGMPMGGAGGGMGGMMMGPGGGGRR